MKFSELKEIDKERVFFEYFFEYFMNKKVEDEIRNEFGSFKKKIEKEYGTEISLSDDGNIEFLGKVSKTKETLILVEYNSFITLCVEKYAFYSPALDKEIDAYCDKEFYAFTSDGEMIKQSLNIDCTL